MVKKRTKHPTAETVAAGPLTANLIGINNFSWGVRIRVGDEDDMEDIIVDGGEWDAEVVCHAVADHLQTIADWLRKKSDGLNEKIRNHEKARARKLLK